MKPADGLATTAQRIAWALLRDGYSDDEVAIVGHLLAARATYHKLQLGALTPQPDPQRPEVS